MKNTHDLREIFLQINTIIYPNKPLSLQGLKRYLRKLMRNAQKFPELYCAIEGSHNFSNKCDPS